MFFGGVEFNPDGTVKQKAEDGEEGDAQQGTHIACQTILLTCMWYTAYQTYALVTPIIVMSALIFS